MKKFFILSVLFLMVNSALTGADKDTEALDFIKTLISKSQEENGYTNALRFFQYTSTTAKNNPYSYILSSWGKDAMKESGIEPSDRGKYISALANRSGARIENLWKTNKDELFLLFPDVAYERILKSHVDKLLEFRTRPEFNTMLKKLKVKSKRPGEKTIDYAGEITGWSNYKELTFWYRRDIEKNDKAVFEILNELQTHYSK